MTDPARMIALLDRVNALRGTTIVLGAKKPYETKMVLAAAWPVGDQVAVLMTAHAGLLFEAEVRIPFEVLEPLEGVNLSAEITSTFREQCEMDLKDSQFRATAARIGKVPRGNPGRRPFPGRPPKGSPKRG
jgi:fumarate hydratase class II